jgi:hypothetical protein
MLKRPFRHEFQPVWLIAGEPGISIVCKGAGTLTYFAKEATSVASGAQNRKFRLPQRGTKGAARPSRNQRWNRKGRKERREM